MKYFRLILVICIISLSLNPVTKLSAASTSYKPYLCAMYPAYFVYKDDCSGSNSWYKIYFPDIYSSKQECMRESNRLFNNEMILRIFPDYKKPGDEFHSWVAGCDNFWYY